VELALGIAVVILLIGIRHVGARRLVAGNPRGAWLVFLPTLGFACLFVGVGVMIVARVGMVGIPIAVVATVSLLLLVRAVRASAGTTGTPAESAALGEGPWFDYIVWGAVGMPILIVVVILLLAITGGLR
jgi:hypothetical protein